ncbi:13859_t:CDS:2 [Gigaspora margarita]|uniref:13859_t:CDS:1 n=1 Tax=Gigaspora margarita TaxID=4874 RepID=A0ABN7UU99_GIGMA|nr:13859_t:CDS:2 [Gigaspora margarita]
MDQRKRENIGMNAALEQEDLVVNTIKDSSERILPETRSEVKKDGSEIVKQKSANIGNEIVEEEERKTLDRDDKELGENNNNNDEGKNYGTKKFLKGEALICKSWNKRHQMSDKESDDLLISDQEVI